MSIISAFCVTLSDVVDNSVVRGCNSIISHVNSFLRTRVSHSRKTRPWYFCGIYCKIVESNSVEFPVGKMLMRGR
jgi:hypothetical protein